jgi:hypothetical protein
LLGKKGAVLSIDVAVATAIVILVLYSASFYVSTFEDEPLTKVNMFHEIRDIVAILDYSGVLATMNNTTISTNLSGFLDPHFIAEIEIHLYNTTANSVDYVSTEYSHNETQNSTLIKGERIAIISNDVARVRYWIWES